MWAAGDRVREGVTPPPVPTEQASAPLPHLPSQGASCLRGSRATGLSSTTILLPPGPTRSLDVSRGVSTPSALAQSLSSRPTSACSDHRSQAWGGRLGAQERRRPAVSKCQLFHTQDVSAPVVKVSGASNLPQWPHSVSSHQGKYGIFIKETGKHHQSGRVFPWRAGSPTHPSESPDAHGQAPGEAWGLCMCVRVPLCVALQDTDSPNDPRSRSFPLWGNVLQRSSERLGPVTTQALLRHPRGLRSPPHPTATGWPFCAHKPFEIPESLQLVWLFKNYILGVPVLAQRKQI